jgi:hypothetical protein
MGVCALIGMDEETMLQIFKKRLVFKVVSGSHFMELIIFPELCILGTFGG